jgi:hypothetical protein
MMTMNVRRELKTEAMKHRSRAEFADIAVPKGREGAGSEEWQTKQSKRHTVQNTAHIPSCMLGSPSVLFSPSSTSSRFSTSLSTAAMAPKWYFLQGANCMVSVKRKCGECEKGIACM